jgi:hypothetical protein
VVQDTLTQRGISSQGKHSFEFILTTIISPFRVDDQTVHF